MFWTEFNSLWYATLGKGSKDRLLAKLYLGTASKPNRRLTGGSVRFRAVFIVLNNDNRPEPGGTGSRPAVGFWSRPLPLCHHKCFCHEHYCAVTTMPSSIRPKKNKLFASKLVSNSSTFLIYPIQHITIHSPHLVKFLIAYIYSTPDSIDTSHCDQKYINCRWSWWH